MEQLLATKLHIPPLRPELVLRPRLIDQLKEGLHRKLTLISAPAGFGKTTLIGEWLKSLHQEVEESGQPRARAAWFSLDAGDNEEKRFLSYFVTALKRIHSSDTLVGESAARILQSAQRPPAETILTTLINDIAPLAGKIILVLDDFHLVDAPSIHNALGFFIENMPPQIHLVISTREDPLLPLPRLRMRDQVTELRAADLRFSSSESAEFLNRVMGLRLSADDVVALESRTEGWIAGLQLAAISLQGHADSTRLIQAFTGSNRFVLDYLIDEVLNQQPEHVQTFLLQTSILDQLSGSLCDALSGQENGQAILESLERANLFIIPLDNERRWYRYHHLFVDLLRQRLHQTQPEQETLLHSRASAWCEQHALLDKAIEHALLAGEFQRSAMLIAQIADDLWKHGDHLKLRRWLEKLTGEWVCSRPRLCIYHAWFLFSTGRQEEAEGYLLAAEQALANTNREFDDPLTQPEPTTSLDRSLLQGRLDAIRALAMSWGEDFPTMIHHASSAIELLPKRDPWRSMAELVLGDAYFYMGDMEASYQTRVKTAAGSQSEDDLFFFMIANLKVATSLREMGQLPQAIEICQEQIEFARQHGLLQTIFAGWAMGLMGLALAEQNDLDQGLAYTARYLELTKGNDLGFVGSSHLFLAKAQFYNGDVKEAENTLNKLAEIGLQHYLPHYSTSSLEAWQARLCLAQNKLELTRQLTGAHESAAGERKPLIHDDISVVRARLLIVEGDYAGASRLLDPLIDATQNGGSTARLIEVLALQAMAKQAQGEMPAAVAYLERALLLAEPGGYVRVFIDEGPPMARLLFEVLNRKIAPAYVQRLLEAFPLEEPNPPFRAETQPGGQVYIEPLSEREIEVLQLIAAGLSNQAIGAKLYLSLNTVKVHTRNIYGKLGVNSRTQAAARARTLGILAEQ